MASDVNLYILTKTDDDDVGLSSSTTAAGRYSRARRPVALDTSTALNAAIEQLRVDIRAPAVAPVDARSSAGTGGGAALAIGAEKDTELEVELVTAWQLRRRGQALCAQHREYPDPTDPRSDEDFFTDLTAQLVRAPCRRQLCTCFVHLADCCYSS